MVVPTPAASRAKVFISSLVWRGFGTDRGSTPLSRTASAHSARERKKGSCPKRDEQPDAPRRTPTIARPAGTRTCHIYTPYGRGGMKFRLLASEALDSQE